MIRKRSWCDHGVWQDLSGSVTDMRAFGMIPVAADENEDDDDEKEKIEVVLAPAPVAGVAGVAGL